MLSNELGPQGEYQNEKVREREVHDKVLNKALILLMDEAEDGLANCLEQ